MDWHTRYSAQAEWTRELRSYLFERTGLSGASRVLEVGCGTGAVLSSLDTPASIYGLDLDPAALAGCRLHAPLAQLTRGDAVALPFPTGSFDITYCHFLLLWVRDPLEAILEMKRVTRQEGHVLALAEPDYTARVDEPESLAALGHWQAEALRRQGADPSLGRRLADLFARAGLQIFETGPIQRAEGRPTAERRRQEWAVIESDLAGLVPRAELRELKSLDEEAWARGERVLHVPTYFAWGKIC